jgi:hypothetical protein
VPAARSRRERLPTDRAGCPAIHPTTADTEEVTTNTRSRPAPNLMHEWGPGSVGFYETSRPDGSKNPVKLGGALGVGAGLPSWQSSVSQAMTTSLMTTIMALVDTLRAGPHWLDPLVRLGRARHPRSRHLVASSLAGA